MNSLKGRLLLLSVIGLVSASSLSDVSLIAPSQARSGVLERTAEGS